MSLPDGFETGQSVQALDQNQQLLARNGYGVISGGTVSIRSGTLGTGEATVEVASATLLVDGSAVAVSSATVAIEESSTRPRKDLVVYDPALSAGNRLTTITGLPAQADPTGATRQQAEQPAPPALGGAVDALSGSGEPKIPLAEVWVPSAVDAITVDDILDRRQDVAPAVGSIDVAERIGIPVYAADGDAPNSTLYFNSSGGATKFKDASGTIHANTGGSGAKTTLFMSDYVAASDRDGSVAVDSQFDTVISEADPHDTIVFDDGTYQLASGHTITKPVTIEGSNATLRCTNTSNANSSIEFLGGGTGSSTTTTAAVSQGTRSIPVSDSSMVSAGDDVLIMDQTYSEQAAGPAQFARVESVPDSTTIDIFGTTVHEFISGANVYVVDLLDAPKIKNIDTEGGGNRHLAFRWCKDPEFQNTSVSEYLEHSLYALDCWKPRFYAVEATDPRELTSGKGEPIAIYRCSDAYVESARVYDCRRGIDLAWGSHSVTIVDPVIQGFDIAGISVHQADICDQMTVIGGTITSVPDATTGHGVINSPSCSMQVTGTTFVCDRSGISNSGPVQASNCTFEPVSSAAQNAILVTGSHARYDNMFINDPNGHFNEPVRVDTRNGAVEDVYIDADITYTGENVMYVETSNAGGQSIEGVTLRGTTRGGIVDHGIFLFPRNGSIDNADISVDVYGASEQCIRLNGDSGLGIVRIHDCHMESSSTACVYSSNSLSGATVQISNCTFESGSMTLSFPDPVDNLFVTNSLVPGSIDSSGATNKTISGNL